jgi:hypothetical protein
MVYVKERIPLEFQKKHACQYQFLPLDSWLIDRERELMFFYNGGNPLGDETSFILFAKGEQIFISTQPRYHRVGKGGTIEWYNTEVRVPDQLAEQYNDIIELVKEAFSCYGFSGSRNNNTLVTFNESKPLRRPLSHMFFAMPWGLIFYIIFIVLASWWVLES